jgi:phosphate transport system substrate-binding protein
MTPRCDIRHRQTNDQLGRSRPLLLLLAMLIISHGMVLSAAGDDPEPRRPLAGSLTVTGSDTLSNVVALLAEAFERRHPAVAVEIKGRGTDAGPKALIDATSAVVAMNRPLSPANRRRIVEEHGFPPTSVPIAHDALTLYVHRDNPLEHLTLPQVDAIFSAQLLCGAPARLRTWGELGLSAPWAGRAIQPFARKGGEALFREIALCGGDFRLDIEKLVGSGALVEALTLDTAAIGYSGSSYDTAAVRPVALAAGAGSQGRALRPGETGYPLGRTLRLYVLRPPGESLDPVRQAFVSYVLDDEGQEILSRAGFRPLSAAERREAREASVDSGS